MYSVNNTPNFIGTSTCTLWNNWCLKKKLTECYIILCHSYIGSSVNNHNYQSIPSPPINIIHNDINIKCFIITTDGGRYKTTGSNPTNIIAMRGGGSWRQQE